jgi:hypothetical protein
VIVVGTTLTTYAMLDPARSFLWDAWLRNAEEIQNSVTDEVRYFAAIETDGRGLSPFTPLLRRLSWLSGTCWTFSLSDGRTQVTGENRGRHITMGQNLVSEYATSVGATHLLHMASDTEPPPDVLPKLLAVDNGIAAAECPTYCMSVGRTSQSFKQIDDFIVTIGPMTAVCVLLKRQLFKALKWRWDPDLGMTDDPSFSHDAKRLFDVETLTRIDCVAKHHPESIGPIGDRFPGLDLGVY